MSVRSAYKKFRERRLSMRSKLILSLSSIAAILLLSSLISVMEYSSMSNYVSDLIADDIRSINVANRLADMSNTYNLQILEVIGDETSLRVPDFDDGYFKSHCDSLRISVASNQVRPMADSVMYSYSAYMLTSLELEDVMQSDFIDSRSWYFERLQPRFERLRYDMDQLSSSIYKDLERNSATFERGFYRSVIPGIVAVGVGLLLVVMLLFFLLAFYVNPLYRMLDGLDAYRARDKKYSVKFDGDDELVRLNEGISELANENRQFRSRIKTIGKK
jgi:predicted PurR-regulated permease PerM